MSSDAGGAIICLGSISVAQKQIVTAILAQLAGRNRHSVMSLAAVSDFHPRRADADRPRVPHKACSASQNGYLDILRDSFFEGTPCLRCGALGM
jgi:hypothetical protein